MLYLNFYKDSLEIWCTLLALFHFFSLYLLLRCQLFQEHGQKQLLCLALVGPIVKWNGTDCLSAY